VFQRNILSPSSGLKWGAGKWIVHIGSEGGLRYRRMANQSGGMRGRWSGPIGSPHAVSQRGGLDQRERERIGPFRGQPEGGLKVK
jgi:hypothetical protein